MFDTLQCISTPRIQVIEFITICFVKGGDTIDNKHCKSSSEQKLLNSHSHSATNNTQQLFL